MQDLWLYDEQNKRSTEEKLGQCQSWNIIYGLTFKIEVFMMGGIYTLRHDIHDIPSFTAARSSSTEDMLPSLPQ